MATFCVRRDKEFESIAKRLNIHPDTLESIVFTYGNQNNGEFPSDDYILNFFNKPLTEDSVGDYFDEQIFDTEEGANAFMQELLLDHTRDTIIKYTTYDGKIIVKPQPELELNKIKEEAIADGRIILKADGTFDYALAPNGKKSNLNERQWLQVRTKAFKDWFGDWEKYAKLKNATVIWGHPASGKTYLFNQGKKDIIDFNSEYKVRINKIMGLHEGASAKELRKAARKERAQEYHDLIMQLFDEAIAEAKRTRKKLLVSDMMLLREREADIDVITNMSDAKFIERSALRGEINSADKMLWKNDINDAMKHVSNKSKIINTEEFLLDDLYGTNVSKVVDENGEPLVVYHRSDVENISVFEPNKYGPKHSMSIRFGEGASFFTDNKNDDRWGKYQTSYFLNIRTPFETSFQTESNDNAIAKYKQQKEDKPETDGIFNIAYDEDYRYDELVVFNPNQIKSATGNDGGFRNETNDIYHENFEDSYSKDTNAWEDQRLADLYSAGNADSLSITDSKVFDILQNSSYKSLLTLLAQHRRELRGINIRIESPSDLFGLKLETSRRNFGGHRAYYDNNTNTIVLDYKTKYTNGNCGDVLMHELMHALTVDRLQANPEARKVFTDIISEYSKATGDHKYMNSNGELKQHGLEEFVADVWSNTSLVNSLRNITSSKGKVKKSLWDRILNVINSLFSRWGEFREDSLMAHASVELAQLLESNNARRLGGIYNEDLNSAIDTNTISDKTEAYGVEIINGSKEMKKGAPAWQKQHPEGIVAYRKYSGTSRTFTPDTVNEGWIGNPFSVASRDEITVQQFYDWLVSGKIPANADQATKDRANEDFRQAIIQKILATPENAPILYYKELGWPSHATVIGYLVNNKQLLQQNSQQESSPKEEKKTSKTPQQRTYETFTSEQEKLGNVIDFYKDTHTYTVNGKKAQFSVTEFRDFMLGKKKASSNAFLDISSRLGNTHDAFLRDYFMGNLKDSYPNLDQESYDILLKEAKKLEAKLKEKFGKDAIFITDEKYLRTAGNISYNGKNYLVAGTLDMVVVDSKGMLHIVDFKTKRTDTTGKELSEDKIQEYSMQTGLYKLILTANPVFRGKVGLTSIAQFNLKYADPRNVLYGFKKGEDQIYIVINEETKEVIPIQDALVGGNNAFTVEGFYKFRGFANSTDLDEVRVAPIKTFLEQKAEAKRISADEALERIDSTSVEEAAEPISTAREPYEDEYVKLTDAGPSGPYTGRLTLEIKKEGALENSIDSTIKLLPYSSTFRLAGTVNNEYLATLNYLLGTDSLFPIYGTTEVTLTEEQLNYINKTFKGRTNRLAIKDGVLRIPLFTVGYTQPEIIKRQQQDVLLNSSLITPTQLRATAKATIYKVSEVITKLQTKGGYRHYFGEDPSEDYTELTRIDIINKIGLTQLFDIVKQRTFNSEIADDDTPESTIAKMDLIYDNWEAFKDIAYETLIEVEEVTIDTKGTAKYEITTEVSEIFNEESQDVIQELMGDSLESWQSNFRSVSAIASLSKLIKQKLDTLYVLDSEGNIELDEFGIGKHLSIQEAVSKIMFYTQGALSVDAKDSKEDYLPTSMIYMLEQQVETEPWLRQVITLLEGKEDTAANEQFKSQFFSNFKKYFQKYAIVFQDKNVVRVKTINEIEYAQTMLIEAQSKERGYALGLFPLKELNGKVSKNTITKLKELANKLSAFNTKKTLATSDAQRTLLNIMQLLGIDIPEPEAFFDLFSSPANVKSLAKKLFYFINDKDIETIREITSLRTYKDIIKLVAKQQGLEMESCSYEAGKLYYSYVQPSYLNRLMDKLKKRSMSDEEFDDFLQKEYLNYSWFYKNGKVRCRWLELIRNDKDGTIKKNLEHTVMLHYKDKPYVDLSPAEYQAALVEMYAYNNSDYGYFKVPMLSNKPSAEFIKFMKVKSSNYKRTITEYMWYTFLQELDRIKAVRERKALPAHKHIKTFDGERGERFAMLTWLNQYLDGKYKTRPEYQELTEEQKEQEDSFAQLLNDKLNNRIQDHTAEASNIKNLFAEVTSRGMDAAYQDAKKDWIASGFITVNNDGEIIDNFEHNKKWTNNFLEEYFWQDFFASTQIMELTITDPAFYKDAEDLQKRIAQIHSPGMQPNVYALDSKGRPYTKDGVHRVLVIKDSKVPSKILKNLELACEQIEADTPQEYKEAVKNQLNIIRNSFKKINSADAQGYSCPTSYRKKLGIFGNWNPDMEMAYNKLMHPEEYHDTNLYEIIKTLWQPLKPFTFSQVTRQGIEGSEMSTIKTGIQIKDSEYVLMMVDALLRRGNQPNVLSVIYQFMEDSQKNDAGEPNGEGIDTVVFESGVKTGQAGTLDLNNKTEEQVLEELNKAYTRETDEKGNTRIVYNLDYVYEMPFEDYIIQQNVPAHFRDHNQAHGSQQRVLIFADMQEKDSNGEDIMLTLNGKPWKTVAQAKQDYNEAIGNNITESVHKLEEIFELTSLDERQRNVALSRKLKEAILADSRCGSDLLWACDTNKYGYFNIPLSDPIHSDRIQMLLNSIIKSEINKQKIPGGPVVQVSSYGTSDELLIRWKNNQGQLLLSEEEFNNKNFPKDFSNADKWQQIEDYHKTYEDYIADQAGVAYFECYAPAPSKEFLEEFTKIDDEGNPYIDIEAIEANNPALLQMIGYRIPTESKYSMVPLRIKGFLPASSEGIMLPAEITEMSGSDFDIDKLYIMKYSFIKNKEGKYVNNSGTGMLRSREERNNLIVDTSLAVLESEQVQSQLFTPGNFELPKKISYLVSAVQQDQTSEASALYKKYNALSTEELKKLTTGKLNLAFANVQVRFHRQNMAAAKLIGVFARANVSHAFLSQGKSATLYLEDETYPNVRLEGISLSGEVSIDGIYQKNQKATISSNLAALLAASVDAVKDPILNLANINMLTVNSLVSLLRIGVDLETATLFLSQPIVRKAISMWETMYGGKRSKFKKVIKECMKDIPKESRDIGIDLSKQDLIDNLNGGNVNTSSMALHLLNYLETSVNNTFRQITNMTSYNSISSAVGPFASDTAMQRREDNAFFNNPFIGKDIKSLMGAGKRDLIISPNDFSKIQQGNPVLIAFREGSNYIERQILGNNILQASDTFRDCLNRLEGYIGYITPETAKKFQDFFMSYYVNSGESKNSTFDLSYDNRKYMLSQFPKDFEAIKKKIKGNALINSIQMVESDSEEFAYLELRYRGLKPEKIQDLKSAWTELYNDPNTRKLAIRLVEYNFFRGSFGFNPKTFMNLVPPVLKKALNNYVDILNDKSSLLENRDNEEKITMIYQFILNNPDLVRHKYAPLNQLETSTNDDGNIEITRDQGNSRVSITAEIGEIIMFGYRYFVVTDIDPETVVVQEVSPLGGNGQGFEISNTERFPKTVFNPFLKKDANGTLMSGAKDKDTVGILLDNLFEDEDLAKVLALSPAAALGRINKALKESGIDKSVSYISAIRKVLKEVAGVSNPRKLLNKANKTMKDIGFCPVK